MFLVYKTIIQSIDCLDQEKERIGGREEEIAPKERFESQYIQMAPSPNWQKAVLKVGAHVLKLLHKLLGLGLGAPGRFLDRGLCAWDVRGGLAGGGGDARVIWCRRDRDGGGDHTGGGNACSVVRPVEELLRRLANGLNILNLAVVRGR